MLPKVAANGPIGVRALAIRALAIRALAIRVLAIRVLACALAAAAALAGAAAAASDNLLQDVRVWAAPDRTRVVFDLTQPFEHEIFSLENPRRLVVDIPNVSRVYGLGEQFAGKGFVEQVRSGIRQGDDLRLVLDLERKVSAHSFTLTPNGDYGYRLVLDLESGDPEAQRQPQATTRAYRERELVVAIDAGHGGEDPGAIGPSGTYEKDVVLEIARRLADMVDAAPGMRAVLIRTGDYYIGLRERIKKAREAKADLFVSIHANAWRQSGAHGSSVYVLSTGGASSEHARWLAQQENAADLLGGVSLANKDADLASFMLDLSQGASIEASLDVGARVLNQLQQINDLHKAQVQQAAFLVLKSPDIPSLLVETAFITNPGEERRLNSNDYQKKLARAVLQGIRGYFASYRPLENPIAATQVHEVRPGETLSGIASRYGVSLAALRRLNEVAGDIIHVGDTLRIPTPKARLAAS